MARITTAHLPELRDHHLNRDTPKSLPRSRWHASIAGARPQGLQSHAFSTDSKTPLSAAGL